MKMFGINNFYLWFSFVCAVLMVVALVNGFFSHNFDSVSIFALCAAICHSKHDIEKLKEQLNEPKPPQQD